MIWVTFDFFLRNGSEVGIFVRNETSSKRFIYMCINRSNIQRYSNNCHFLLLIKFTGKEISCSCLDIVSFVTKFIGQWICLSIFSYQTWYWWWKTMTCYLSLEGQCPVSQIRWLTETKVKCCPPFQRAMIRKVKVGGRQLLFCLGQSVNLRSLTNHKIKAHWRNVIGCLEQGM